MRGDQNENIQDQALHGEAEGRDLWFWSGLIQIVLKQEQKFLPSDQYHS